MMLMLTSIRSTGILLKIAALIFVAGGLSTIAKGQGANAKAEHRSRPAEDVNVVNTPGVNVANTPGVTVTNTPTVNVGNTPAVNVANTPTVQVSGTASVDVKNDASAPVVTGSVDDPARQALNIFQRCDSKGAETCSTIFNVPANKELVLEYVSVLCFGFGSPNPARSEITTTAGGSTVTYHFPRGDPSPVFNNEFLNNASVKIYADPGTTVTLTGVQVGNGSTFQFSLSAHYVNVP